MKRRGFLGFIGGAAVAGPAMAKQAVVQGMEALSLGNTAGLISGGNMAVDAPYYGGQDASIGYGPDDNPNSPSHWTQKQLAEFMGRSAEDLRLERVRTHVSALDPDLAVNRSFSLSAKIRIQRDRNFERNREDHKFHIMRDIKNAMTRWAERGIS